MKLRPRQVFAGLLLALAAAGPASAQDATPTPGAALSFTAPQARVAFSYPAGWAVRDGRAAFLATSAAMLDWRMRPDAAVAPGEAAIQIELVTLADAPAGESGALRLAAALESDLSRDYDLAPVDTFTSGGAAAALVSAVAPGFEASIVLLDAGPGEVFAVLFAAAPGESPQREAALVTVIESLARVPAPESTAEPAFEPTPTAAPEVTPTTTPAAVVTYESAALGLRFDHPASWTITGGRVVYASTDADHPTWDFGDPPPLDGAALNIQQIALADTALPVTSSPRDFLNAALAGIPDTFTVGDIVERAFDGSGPGALVQITSAEFDALALVLPGRPGTLIGIQAATVPGALDSFAPQVLALADSLALNAPTPTPRPQAAVITTGAFTFEFPADWSLGAVSSARAVVSGDGGRVEVEALNAPDVRAYLRDLAGADAVVPLTVAARDGWQAVTDIDGADALLVALDAGDCALLVRASGFEGAFATAGGLAQVLNTLACAPGG